MSDKETPNEVFREDPRYKQANKEALLGVGLFILNFIWWFAFGYGLGGKPPEQYTYVLGLPSWFFWSCVAGFVVFWILAHLMVTLFFKDIPLDEKGGTSNG